MSESEKLIQCVPKIKERVKLFYGTTKINYLKNYITILDKTEINVYQNEDYFMAVYGELLYSTPIETLKIRLSEEQKQFFPSEKEIYKYILNGENNNLEQQKKICTVARIQIKYGKQIEEKQKEVSKIINNMIQNGEKKKSINCNREFNNILGESAKKKYCVEYESCGDILTLLKD